MFYYGLYIEFLNSQMPSFKSHLKTYLFKQAYNYFKFFLRWMCLIILQFFLT